MKNNLTLIVILGLVIWNIVLTLQPKEQKNDINYELLQELHKQNERDFQKFELQINQLQNEIKQDSAFVYSATRSERDSLRSILNPF